VAPFNYGDLGGRHGRLKNDISYEYDEKEMLGTVTVNSSLPVKAVVQEFGYPKDMKKGASILDWDDTTSRWNAPYKPNPKRKPQYSGVPGGKIKGLGYLRVGAVLAANSLLSDKPSIPTYSKPTKSDVDQFKKIVASRYIQAVRKFTLAYGKANRSGLPKYMTNNIKFPEQAVLSKYVSNIKINELKVRVPLKLDVRGIQDKGPLIQTRRTRPALPVTGFLPTNFPAGRGR
jgi:hypothetical protein